MLWTQFCVALGSFDIASGVVYPFFSFFPLVLRRSNCEFGYNDVNLGVESGGQRTGEQDRGFVDRLIWTVSPRLVMRNVRKFRVLGVCRSRGSWLRLGPAVLLVLAAASRCLRLDFLLLLFYRFCQLSP